MQISEDEEEESEGDGGFIQHPEMGKRNSKRQTRERERERYTDNRLPKQNNVV
jgi:hypothetical protein